jgi:protein SYS1
MTFFGIWACQYRELRPINFGGLGESSSTANTTDSNPQPGDPLSQDPQVRDADKESESDHRFLSISRGRGRGRNRDASDDYEMVTMKDVEEGVV